MTRSAGHPEAIGGRGNDALVGLVRNEAAKIRAGHAIALQQLARGLRHLAHGKLVDRLSILVDVVHLLVDGLVASADSGCRRPCRFSETPPDPSISCTKSINADLAFFRGLNQHRAAAIAKQNARSAVGVVGHARIGVGSADQHLRLRAALHQLHARLQRKHKPEQPAETSNPHAPLAPILSCTRQAVDGNIMSGVTVPTMITSTSLGSMPRAARHFFAASTQMSLTPLPLGEHVAFLDAGALHDPLVVGVHHFFEVLIGKNLRGNVGSEAL